MNVLGILGSPRLGGNADTLLDEALRGAREAGAKTEKIILRTMKFSPCLECGDAPKNGTCKVRDDMQTVYKKIEEADAVVIASPIFFGSLSAQTKMMIDRFQCRWMALYEYKTLEKAKIKKAGAFLCVEGTKRTDFFENAKAIIKNFFATIDARYEYELACPGVNEKAEIKKRAECLEQAYLIGKKLASHEARI